MSESSTSSEHLTTIQQQIKQNSENLFNSPVVKAIFVFVIVVILVTTIRSYLFSPLQQEDMTCGKTSCSSNSVSNETLKVGKKSYTKVLWFYAPWCGHCKVFAPQWERFLNMKPSNFPAEKINGDEDRESMEKYQIDGFPTFVFLKGDSSYETYPMGGSRTAEGLLQFINQ